MSTSFATQLCRPILPHRAAVLRQAAAASHRPPAPALLKFRPPSGWTSISRWAAKSSLAEKSPTKEPDLDVKGLVDFLYEDLPHLFDEQGIDRTMYDDVVRFRDPITKHDSIDGYLFNIRLLKVLFQPDFQLHRVWQTGPYEITTRWTMVMKFALLPWKPELVFTGVSIMGVNPQTKKFCSHVDLWDSIENNDYFSFEGLLDVLKQLRIYKTPDLESPKYQILERTATYEALDDQLSNVSIQIVLPNDRELDKLPAPTMKEISLKKMEGGIAAVTKFSGRPTEELVRNKERELRSVLLKSGLKPRDGCLLARYNDPGRTWSFLMRNEVLIWLDDFKLD